MHKSKNGFMDKGVKGIYPHPQRVMQGEGRFVADLATGICIAADTDMKFAQLLQKHIMNNFGTLLPIRESGTEAGKPDIFLSIDEECIRKPEGYNLSISNDNIKIIGNDKRGLLYGIQTLLQLGVKGREGRLIFPGATIQDWPYKTVRGIHVYLPARESIPGFKRLIEMLAYIKMNTIIIEVGGGMEYERHPEINKAWEKFCREAEAYPGGPAGLQNSEFFWKDSMHTELGGRSYLSKKEVREIVGFAKDLGLDVIPELQALSHCYYLAVPHREIAERSSETYPDTYCPSNPSSYELYFDVADEVIEVFQPEYVSIGHDEFYTMGECPLCRDKTGEELLAYDINTLYKFYKSKGIQIAMWGEKLQKFTGYDGVKYGGIFREKTDDTGRYWRMLETCKAVDLIPRDILMMDWYHWYNQTTELYFRDKGFVEIFGNFSGSMIADWDIRSSCNNVLGAVVSTWCLADEFTIARDNVVFDFVFSAGILWHSGYSDSRWEGENRTVTRLMPRIREILKGKKYPSANLCENNFRTLYTVENICNGRLSLSVESFDGECGGIASGIMKENGNQRFLAGLDFNAIDNEIEIGAKLKSMVFHHAAAQPMKFIHSYELKDMSDYILGRYEIYFDDGSVENVDLHYGIHVGHINTDWNRYRCIDDSNDNNPEIIKKENITLPPYYHPAEQWYGSLAYFTIPVVVSTTEGIKTIFAYEWLNPKPDIKIRSVRPVAVAKVAMQKLLLFGISGS